MLDTRDPRLINPTNIAKFDRKIRLNKKQSYRFIHIIGLSSPRHLF